MGGQNASEGPKGQNKAQGPLINHNVCQMWQGIQDLAICKSNSTTMVEGDATLAQELNHLFGCFEVAGPKAATACLMNCKQLQLHSAKTRRWWTPGMAAGPDGVAGRILTEC